MRTGSSSSAPRIDDAMSGQASCLSAHSVLVHEKPQQSAGVYVVSQPFVPPLPQPDPKTHSQTPRTGLFFCIQAPCQSMRGDNRSA